MNIVYEYTDIFVLKTMNAAYVPYFSQLIIYLEEFSMSVHIGLIYSFYALQFIVLFERHVDYF